LFCGAGGAAAGYARAGFSVVGVDIKPQPRYPFAFVQGDALNPPFDLREFDAIHASPPCQGFTAYKRRPDHVAPRENLIPAVRAMLEASGRPWIIENVPGAPLLAPTMLCGSMFGLDVRRHRWFESTPPVLMAPGCAHDGAPRFAQATNRTNKRRTVEVGVWRIPLPVQRAAMGIDWMDLEELSEAIPPAYTEYLGHRLLEYMGQDPRRGES
jgi:DNA (cytosine-5)-methyltransferase 1